MIRFSFFRSRVFLLALPLLAVLLFVGRGTPGVVSANGGGVGDIISDYMRGIFGGELSVNAACWSSGPRLVRGAGEGFGSGVDNATVRIEQRSWYSTGKDKGYDFVVDRNDLGNDGSVLSGASPKDQIKTPDTEVRRADDILPYSFFTTMPEYVDYAFYVDVFDTSSTDRKVLDRRIQRMAGKFTGSGFSGYSVINTPHHLEWGGFPREDPRFLFPWVDTPEDVDRDYPVPEALDKYLFRRSVAAPYRNPTRQVSGLWIDPANPGGGHVEDSVAVNRDQVSNWLEVTEGTVMEAGDGGEVTYGTTEGLGYETTFQPDRNCANEGVCDGVFNWNSLPVPVLLHTNLREQNDGEKGRNTTGAGDREILVMEGGREVPLQIPFDNRDYGPGTTGQRRSTDVGYDKQSQRNTDSDQIHVSIVLKKDYRQDLQKYDFGGSNLQNSERGLPVMGFNPWTFENTTDNYRARRHNRWFRDVPSGMLPRYVTNSLLTPDLAAAQYDNQVHTGYRQPSLSRPMGLRGNGVHDPVTAENVAHIRWPVNLEDMNWYLYRIPSEGLRTPMWLYWLTEYGNQYLLQGAYGQSPLNVPPNGSIANVMGSGGLMSCGLTTASPHEFAGPEYQSSFSVSDIECQNPPAPNPDAVWEGTSHMAHLPFDTSVNDPDVPDEYHLGSHLLRKQGVVSPLDSRQAVGNRTLTEFSFIINETEPMGNASPAEAGYDAEKRFGIPRDAGSKEKYLSEWANRSIDPIHPHLLVVTYYEARFKDDVKFKLRNSKFFDSALKMPKREIRRVICRIVVPPRGYDPAKATFSAITDVVTDKVVDFVNKQMEQLGGWIGMVLASVADAPLYAGSKTGELACIGIAKLDDLTSLDNVAGPPQPALVDSEGRIRINAATASKQRGTERCHRISAPVEATCDRSVDIILDGLCTHLPKFKVVVRDADFLNPVTAGGNPLKDDGDPVNPDDPDAGGGLIFEEYRRLLPNEAYYESGDRRDLFTQVELATYEGKEPRFLPAADPDDPDVELTPYNRGLTRLSLGWDFQWQDVDPDIYEHINGFVAFLHPDPKAVSFVVPGTGLPFVLPKWLIKIIDFQDDDDDSSVYYRQERVNGFLLGGLGYHPEVHAVSEDSEPSNFSVISYDEFTPSEFLKITYNHVGGKDVEDDYMAFNFYTEHLPLAPGFRHGVQVAPYVGVPGTSTFRMGPVSDKLWLDGDRAACEVDDAGAVDLETIQGLYNCPSHVTLSGYEQDEFRPGLLMLTGTDICDDIFSSTPAGFTWDNNVVKQAWYLMWVIAGGVFFTLFAWQGLRMTYDIWLDPQPAIGFRELVPRYLLALLLAAGSLLICRMVLTVASDLTCFVAQYTGMSLWGAVGITFGTLIDAFMAWYDSLNKSVEVPLLKLLSNFLLMFVFAVVVVAVIIFILYLFAKVLMAMLIRVALLAVLIAFSPLAFAFYASDSTSHWTKKWVSMFLGTAFQQVVVLIVIYLGIYMMGDYMTGAADGDLTTLMVGAIIAFMTLSLAASVPEIVNPASKSASSFSAFGGLAGMAAAGGMMAASGGVGVLAGVAGWAGGKMGGKDDDDDGSGGPDRRGGDGQSPSSGPSRNVPVMSSVNRQPVGVARTGSQSQVGQGDDGGDGSGSGSGSGSGGGDDGGGDDGGDDGGVAVSTGGGRRGSGGGSAGEDDSGGGDGDSGPGSPRDDDSDSGGRRRRGWRPPQTPREGWRRGIRFGGRMNTMARDIARGNVFYRHGSSGDDSASQISDLRDDMANDRKDQKKVFSDLAKSMNQLNRNLGGETES